MEISKKAKMDLERTMKTLLTVLTTLWASATFTLIGVALWNHSEQFRVAAFFAGVVGGYLLFVFWMVHKE